MGDTINVELTKAEIVGLCEVLILVGLKGKLGSDADTAFTKLVEAHDG